MNTERLDNLLDQSGYPALDLAVWREGRPVYRRTAGFKDRRKTVPMPKDCMFKLYSASKVITNTAVMQLIESGKIGPDDELGKYLPAFAEMKVKDGNTVRPAKNKITIRLLQCMSAGLNYEFTAALGGVLVRTQGKATTRELVDAVASSPLDYEPGTHFKYSLAHDVLGAVIEVVSGMRFGEYLQRNIYEPLGMKDTTFRPTKAQRARLTQQYQTIVRKGREIFLPVPMRHPLVDCSKNLEGGGGGIYSTADDYILFADALCNEGLGSNGARILQPESVRLMKQNQLDEARLADFAQLNKRGYGYGLGVRTMMDPSGAGARSPVGEFGWDGAAGAYVLIDTTNRLACFLGMQVFGNDRAYRQFHPAVRDTVYETLGL
ncbi:MAG TPA: serine hydrolase domain-containing protein [Clostridiales bacterium]|nr:serine hydrolase domain-containing protein [Clostridiales bacterium]